MCVPGQSLTLHTACSYAMPNAGESMSAPLYVCVCDRGSNIQEIDCGNLVRE